MCSHNALPFLGNWLLSGREEKGSQAEVSLLPGDETAGLRAPPVTPHLGTWGPCHREKSTMCPRGLPKSPGWFLSPPLLSLVPCKTAGASGGSLLDASQVPKTQACHQASPKELCLNRGAVPAWRRSCCRYPWPKCLRHRRFLSPLLSTEVGSGALLSRCAACWVP